MRHVFISYKHDDLDFAENVRNRLENAHFKTWMDEHIHAGEEWRNQIDQAIKGAFAMIVIMTPDAKASEYITYEWSFAFGIGVRIIPLKLRSTSLHPRLAALQYLDFTSKSNSNRPWDRLLAEVEEASKAPISSPASAPAASVPSFIQQAKAALNSTDANVRKDAIATLAQANNYEAQEALLEALSHPVADVREQAAIASSDIHYQAAVPRLIELLHDSVPGVRMASIGALEAMKDARAIPALLEVLEQADPTEKIRIVGAFGIFGDASVVPALLVLYEQAHAELREIIIYTLGNLNSFAAIPTLAEALQDPNLFVCRSATRALLQIGSNEAINAIVVAVLSMSKTQCEIMLNALSSSPQSDRLIACLDDIYQEHLPVHSTRVDREKNAKVRRRIIWAFGLLKDNKAIPTLIQSMDDEDPVVQRETIMAFKIIQDERALPALMTILRWRFEYYDERTLLCAIQALRQVGNASVIPQLKAVLNEMLDKHTELAIQVIDVFANLGDYETIEYLRRIQSGIKQNDFEKKQELTEAVHQAIKRIRSRL